jgi:tRNA dimethylallyltransferase
MEYKHVAQFIDGEVSYKAMVENLKNSIHQLAKRQETWFRGMERRGHAICWVDNADKDIAFSILEKFSY